MQSETPAPPQDPLHARPRVWTVFAAYLVTLALPVLAATVFGFVLGMRLVMTQGVKDRGELAARLRDQVATPEFLIGGALVSSLTMLGVAALALRRSRRPAAQVLRTGESGAGPGRLALMTLFVIAVSVALSSVAALLGVADQGSLARMSQALTGARGWTLVAAVTVIGGVSGSCEEIFFRGFMQTRLRARWGGAAAVALTSLAFGAAHLDLIHTTLTVFLGAALGWITELSNSIRPAILAHVANNMLWILGASAGVQIPETGALALSSLVLVASALALARSRRAPAAQAI